MEVQAQTKLTLLDEFQLQFPSLDSSLIAAFLSERDSETLTKRQLRKLRRILAKLATGADHDEQLVNEALSGPHIDGISLSSSTMDRSNETSSALSDATSPLASPRSTSSAVSFSSLGFLHAAFPGVSPIRLERVITEASCDGQFADGVDVERAIHLLLDEEFLPDLVEDDALDLPPTPREEWPTVEIKGKKKRTKSKTVIVNDIRQQRHVYKSASGSCHGPRFIIPPRSPDVDIWSSISSISAQLAALLPPHSESFFKSFFHSPDSKTPATAVRRALTAIIRDSDVPPLDMIVLLNLQDILRSTPEYDEISTEGQKRLFSDAHLCLHAVGSQADNAFDIVRLLRRLDKDDEAGWKVAPYHQGPLLHQDNSFLEASEDTPFPTSEAHLELRLGRPPGRPPSQLQNEWNVVPGRKRPTAVDHHQGSIPASNDSHETSTHQNGIAGDNDLARLNERVDDLKTRMEESYMSAARAWKGGNSKNRGRQVSMYYVEEGCRLREKLNETKLDYERARVNATIKTTASETSIDLHYTPAAQAVILAKEFLIDYDASDMRFITGRGKHSVGGKAVLGPAVYNALIKAGWNASKLPDGLIVHGRLPG